MLSRHHFEFSLLMKVALIVFTSTFVLCKDITDAVPQLRNFTENSSRVLSVLPSARANPCDDATASNAHFQSYFSGMDSIYPPQLATQTCLPIHKKCGWPRTQSQQLPMFVFSVGLEGAGHHLWTEIMNAPVFDCVWINGRHYNRIIGDGVPRTTVENLKEGINEQFQLRKAAGKPPCRSIFDAEDSFPTGAIRKSGRVFMRPDIINLQKLDGVMMNVKYLLILRNTTDTVLSSLRRNFFSHVDQGLRTVEHSLSYMEAAMRGVPCHKIFIAHYEHVLADPHAFYEPLAQFLELEDAPRQALRKKLSKKGRVPKRKMHKLTQYAECKGLSEERCYKRISALLDDFLNARGFMWPTFTANGFDFNPT